MVVRVKVEVAIDAVETAVRYIESCGANQTEKGLPHPQLELLNKLELALIFLDSTIEDLEKSDRLEEYRKNITL